MKRINYATLVAHGTTWAIRLALAYLWTTILGIGVGIAHALDCAARQANHEAFCTGISPASMQSGQAPQAALVTHYNAKFTKNLKARTPSQRVISRREMPLKAGQKYRDFMYQALPANTQNAAEGVIGTGIQIGVAYLDYTLGQWADYMNFSDFVLATTIDPMLENCEREMAYRLGLTIQKLTLAQMDAARTVDTSVGALDATTATQIMTRNTGTQAAGSLRGRNVQPLEGMGRFGSLIHPFFTTDMMVDNTNNSYVDILKHTPEGQMAIKELPAPDGENVTITSMGGISYMETTALTTTTNWKSTGATAIRTYVLGEDGVLGIRLERPDKTKVGDGDHRNLKLWRGQYAQGTSNDPAGMIGGGTSYNIVATWGLPPDTTMRLRAYDFVPQNT